VPAAESLEALNARLEAACPADLDRKASGQSETIGSRLEADLAVFRPLPSGTFEACEKRTARVSSTSLVRYRTSDYSVPTSYGFRDVVVKGFVDQVVIICDGEEIARHKRSYPSSSNISGVFSKPEWQSRQARVCSGAAADGDVRQRAGCPGSKGCHTASCCKYAFGVTRSRLRRRQAVDPLPGRAASGAA
jgi:hypothetical protein